jgi:phosphatidylinositol-3-phosphatase
MVVMLENKGYKATLGSCSADPYFCSLASSYASATGWTGVSHPSEPNYLAATSGSTQGCSSDTCFTPYNVTSLGGQLTAAGIPWKAYMESMPSACFSGQWFPSASNALYGEKHDPFVVFNDVLNNGCASHVVPYPGASGLVAQLDGSGAADFVWITPNQQDDMHSNTVQAGDAWLKANIAPVFSSSWFTGGNASVIITMDEDEGNNTGGGGPVPMVVISSNASGKGNVSLSGNHYGMLRSIEEAYGLNLLGAASNSTNGDLSSLFG